MQKRRIMRMINKNFNRIDIYFDDHQEALNFGVQYAEVMIKVVEGE